jgi:hypothetical protein
MRASVLCLILLLGLLCCGVAGAQEEAPPEREIAPVIKGQRAYAALSVGQFGLGGAFCALHVASTIRMDQTIRTSAAPEWHPTWTRLRGGHLVTGVLCGLRLVPLVMSADLARGATDELGLARATSTPYLLLGLIDLAVGVSGLATIVVIREYRGGVTPSPERGSTLGDLYYPSETALNITGIAMLVLGTLEFTLAAASGEALAAEQQRQRAMPPGLSMRLDVSPGWLGVSGEF